jgi:hypothetical protein
MLGGEHPRLVLQGLIEHHIAVAGAEGLGLGVVERLETHGRQSPEIGLAGPLEVELVVEPLGRGLAGVAVLQLQCPEPGL